MYTTRNYRLVRSLIGGCLLMPALARADHVQFRGKEVDILRRSLGNGEGYLNFALFDNGAEYTGYTDAAETPRDGGRDFSDNSFTIHPIIVTDENGIGPQRAGGIFFIEDIDFTRKIWAQAGLGVLIDGVASVTPADYQELGKSPFGFVDMLNLARDGAGRSTNTSTLNVYFVNDIDSEGTLGFTHSARNFGADVAYSVVQDGRSNGTIAHEIGHMLFNGSIVYNPDPKDSSHSTEDDNLMYAFADSSLMTLTQVGPDLGALGGKAKLESIQIQAVHGNPGANNPGFIKHASNAATAGDSADFNWVADSQLIEQIPDGSHGADLKDGDLDELIWEINSSEVSNGPEHGHPAGSLAGSGFDGAFFKIVDVFSNINRYADNDFTPGSLDDLDAIRRSKALDFFVPEFSTNGADWKEGELVNVFKPGWTNAFYSDDFVSRWKTDLEAIFVRIRRFPIRNIDGHDGNVQIDAVMAVAEPVEQLAVVQLEDTHPETVLVTPGDTKRIAVRDIAATGPKGYIDIVHGIAIGQPPGPTQPLDVRITADGSDSSSTGTGTRMQWNHVASVLAPVLPERSRYEFSLTWTDSDFPTTGDVGDRRSVVPFEDGELFNLNLTPDMNGFDATIQVLIDGGEIDIFQIRGQTLSADLKFDEVFIDPFSFDPANDFEASFFFALTIGNDAVSPPGGFLSPAGSNLSEAPLFALDITGATPVPEPTMCNLLVLLVVIESVFRYPRKLGDRRGV